jgi:CRISPR system Cascade subunit CasB
MSTEPQIRPTSASLNGHHLVEHLNSLVTNRDVGALALLRRGLGREPGEVPAMYSHVLPYLALSDSISGSQRQREEDAALLVASLFALWHQGKGITNPAERISLGAAFRRLINQSDSFSLERRFVALLKASRDRLPNHLRHAISLLKAKDIPLDWALLFSDLSQWDQTDQRARHPIRRRWARDFWEHAKEPAEAGARGDAPDEGGDDDE